jgi:hypothetical protein
LFSSCGQPPPLRKVYLEASPAVNKMMAEMWEEGKLLLLPTEAVKKIEGVHFSPMSWAPKADKKEGRPIGDLSSPPGGAVNCQEAADLVRDAWGPIELPTLTDIVRMILKTADQFGWPNIELWKMDLKGAFTLLNFRPQDVKWLAFELTGGLTAVHIVGMFGWCGCPFGFAVFSRVLIALVNQATGREGVMYVDDVCAAGPISSGAADRETARVVIEGVMGPGSVAPKKTEAGRSLTMIGWEIDLDKRLVSLSKKNLFKTLFAFFSVDLGGGITLPVVQALASRASRAAVLAVAMQPFTRGLFNCMCNYRGDRGVKRKLSAEAKFEVLMWRAYLVQLMWDPGSFARPLETFRPQLAEFQIEYDASLTGLGFLISKRGKALGTWDHLCHWGGDLPFGERLGPGKSGYQNACELAAVVAALAVMRQMGLRDFAVEVRGDNTSSLSWLKNGGGAAGVARATVIGVHLLLMRLGARVVSATHVAGQLNGQMDKLSRGQGSLGAGLPAHQRSLWFEPGGWAWQYVAACAPVELCRSVESDSMGVVSTLVAMFRR